MSELFAVKGGVRDFSLFLQSLEQDMDLSPKQVVAAAVRSINRSLITVRKVIDQGRRQRYYVKSADVKKSLRMIKARSGKVLYGALDYESEKSLPLYAFSARKSKNFVSVKVLKKNRQRKIQPGGEKNIVATKKGRAAVWIARDKSGNLQVFSRTGDVNNKEKQGVRVLYGSSFMSFFGQAGINEELHKVRRVSMRKNMLHEVKAIKEGYIKQ